MNSKYNFTLDTFDKNRYEHYNAVLREMEKIQPTTPWDELKVGNVYHLPNILISKRADFIITEIKTFYLNGLIKEEGSTEWRKYSLFKNETKTKFLVERYSRNKK